MIFQRINRGDPEKLFLIVKNGYATASLTSGQAVMWGLTAADGVTVTRPTARATNGGIAAAGVMAATVAYGSYGLCQVLGYHSAVRVRAATGGSPAIVAGRPLALNAAGSLFCLESIATSSISVITYPMGFALASNALWTTSAVAAFIKAL